MNPKLLHTSFPTFLSGLTTFGVPEAFVGEDTQEPLDLFCIVKGRGKELIIHTFEALVQTPGPLEQLVEVRPAVEHSLEGVVVGKLRQRTSSDKSMLVNSHYLINHIISLDNSALQIDQLKHAGYGTLRVPLQWWQRKQALW